MTMAEPPVADPPSTRALDIAWHVVMGLSVAFIAFMAWDMLSGGQATEQARAVFHRFRPLPAGGSDDESG